ncbi:MAG TPA: DUF4926 domain-containing protein [Rhizomicrobium sp.]|jgi:hypothetical protein|nr:DUF4926 domain-containing protein [Rhizomicrobium sp.]
MDVPNRRKCATVHNLLGIVMAQSGKTEANRPSILSPVALLGDRPGDKLARGQVGTVVEDLDGGAVLVEFSDDQGRAYGIVPCLRAELIVLHYVPESV